MMRSCGTVQRDGGEVQRNSDVDNECVLEMNVKWKLQVKVKWETESKGVVFAVPLFPSWADVPSSIATDIAGSTRTIGGLYYHVATKELGASDGCSLDDMKGKQTVCLVVL
jgi:hypothetical protein